MDEFGGHGGGGTLHQHLSLHVIVGVLVHLHGQLVNLLDGLDSNLDE